MVSNFGHDIRCCRDSLLTSSSSSCPLFPTPPVIIEQQSSDHVVLKLQWIGDENARSVVFLLLFFKLFVASIADLYDASNWRVVTVLFERTKVDVFWNHYFDGVKLCAVLRYCRKVPNARPSQDVSIPY